jgi:GDP-4-dehydro-6-deoxy-D-mannose reductase
MLQTALITGGTGFVGSHLQHELGNRYRVVSLGSDTDVRDREALRAVVAREKPDVVVHLASITTLAQAFADPLRTYDVIFGGTLNLLNALKLEGFKSRMLYASSSRGIRLARTQALPINEMHPLRPRSPYAVAKIAAEMLCYQWSQEHLFDIVVARPFNHIGPGRVNALPVASFACQMAAIRSGIKSPVLEVGYLDATRDFCDVRDVAKAYATLLERGHNGETYNVCTGREVSMRQVVEGLIRLAGVHVELRQDATRIRSEGLQRICGDFSKIYREHGVVAEDRLDDTLSSMLEQ